MISRVDHTGLAFAGSQRQIQYYVNERAGVLSANILKCARISASTNLEITWVSPLKDNFYQEYRDEEALNALGLQHCNADLLKFWPSRGPVWDALGKIIIGQDTHYFLIEAKSHIHEVYGTGCGAKRAQSITMINKALTETKTWLGVEKNMKWKGRLYQSANRLAFLYWMHKRMRLNAWLVNLYFMDDPYKPTSEQDWLNTIPSFKQELGVGHVPFCLDLLLRSSK